MRHLFYALDGATIGSHGFSGSVGKRLVACIEQPVSSFEPVQLTKQQCNVDPGEMITFQQYLLEMCNRISCSIDLAMRNPGCLNHTLYYTFATTNRERI